MFVLFFPKVSRYLTVKIELALSSLWYVLGNLLLNIVGYIEWMNNKWDVHMMRQFQYCVLVTEHTLTVLGTHSRISLEFLTTTYLSLSIEKLNAFKSSWVAKSSNTQIHRYESIQRYEWRLRKHHVVDVGSPMIIFHQWKLGVTFTGTPDENLLGQSSYQFKKSKSLSGQKTPSSVQSTAKHETIVKI